MEPKITLGNPSCQEEYYAGLVSRERAKTYACGVEYWEKWRDRARQHMKDRGIHQKDVALKLDVVQPQIAHWLHGRRVPSLTEFFQFAAEIGASPKFLLFGDDSPWHELPDAVKDYLAERGQRGGPLDGTQPESNPKPRPPKRG